MGKTLDDDRQAPTAVDHQERILKTRLMKPGRIALETKLFFQESEGTPADLLKQLLGIGLLDLPGSLGRRFQLFHILGSVPQPPEEPTKKSDKFHEAS